MRTILSNKIRGQLLDNVKASDLSVTISKFVKRDNSEWVGKFPEIKNLIRAKNLIKQRKYKKSINSRIYNPYHAYLALPYEAKMAVICDFS
jgi:hypothetical protein